ncbi:MAG: site-2 protease family protein [Pontiellaceae bacterium]|jgi:Zn-dependent protease|nr:site-2 protease family protein [Pontiellaceae bacterium]
MFIEQAQNNPDQYVLWIMFAVFSICVHESSHAWTAVRFGDNTPRQHISLNPLKQMGWLSLIMLCVIGIAWGSVPVNPDGTGSRKRNALVYLAGPAANLGLCAVFALLAQTARLWESPPLEQVFHYGSYVNGALCLLNLCPVPPLDGFGIIRSLVSDSSSLAASLNRFAGIGLLLLWLTPVASYLFLGGAKLAEFFTALWLAPFHLFG